MTRLLILAPLLALMVGLLGIAPAKVPDFDTSPLVDATIPVLVPTAVPNFFLPVYMNAIAGAPMTQDGGYVVIIGGHPDCDGGTACTLGQVEGEPTHSHRIPAGYHSVRMHDGTTGYYVNGKCGANCEDSFNLVFFKANAKYIISLKGGRLDEGLLIEQGLRKLDR
jgi:hypothetical protein